VPLKPVHGWPGIKFPFQANKGFIKTADQGVFDRILDNREAVPTDTLDMGLSLLLVHRLFSGL
jgi:hypothetical protein